MTEFQRENNEVLKYILEERFFSKFTPDYLAQQSFNGLNIELFITPVCNQACEYCYLIRHSDGLYPKEIRDFKLIKKNLKIFMEFLLERKYAIHDLDLFSGEIWGMKQGNEILDILLDYRKKGVDFKQIMIPSNFSFCTDEKIMKIIQNYIYAFREAGCELRFSASLDGPILEQDTRSFVNKKNNNLRDDNFYQRAIDFCVKNKYGFHPMVSAYSIERWKDNYVWWMDVLKKYNLPEESYIMFLEVRNDDWTPEKIKSYLDFLNFAIDYSLEKKFNGNISEFTKKLFDIDRRGGVKNYNIYDLSEASRKANCSIGRSLVVRLGDLAIVPCHRTSYEVFNYGKFVVEDNKIVDIEANNIQMANKVLLGSTKTTHKCDCCLYNQYCLRGCQGSQYEVTKDPFLPIESVCSLYISKINFLIHKFEKLGVFKELNKCKDKDSSLTAYINRILEQIENIKSGGLYPYEK